MLLTLRPTSKMVQVDGTRCRLWAGTDADGTDVHAYIAAVSPQTYDPERLESFDRTLEVLPTPAKSPDIIDLRFVI